MTIKIRLKMKNRSHRNDINRPRPRYGHKYTKYKMCLVHFLVNKQTQKHSTRSVLKNMCSGTMKVTENPFFTCVLLEILIKYKKTNKKNARTLDQLVCRTTLGSVSEGRILCSRLRLKAPRDHI